jgi:hypothetical protein
VCGRRRRRPGLPSVARARAAHRHGQPGIVTSNDDSMLLLERESHLASLAEYT